MKYLIICPFILFFSGCSALTTSPYQENCLTVNKSQIVNQAILKLEVHLRPPVKPIKKPNEETKFNESILAFLTAKAVDSQTDLENI
ncbi:hypothetical protein [Acinetobacter seifertii]|uniref:hypothetical protein n=1 Tax=Acinetobacter seifertii TaxID=1530123 RepID=UPI000C21EB9F|nr:hypothetical protein [Acinetobacter seifertii]PJG65516.1 hypothetical protein CVD09_15935 [Acinetobacter seifertii]